MALALSTIEEKLRNVSKVLAMQEQHIAALHEELRSHQEKAAATAQAAETGCRKLQNCGDGCNRIITSSSVTAEQLESLNKKLTAGRLAEGRGQGQGCKQETVPPSKAGAALDYKGESKGQLSGKQYSENMQKLPAYNIEAGERAAYLRGFEAAKALLLAVKPEPERGPDNFLWVNVYKHCVEGDFILSRGYETKADASWHSVPSAYKHCGLIRVWFNEGQYDD